MAIIVCSAWHGMPRISVSAVEIRYWSTAVEPMTGIEPAYSAWEADVLPLNYIGVAASEG
jgi:hypothetical protein